MDVERAACPNRSCADYAKRGAGNVAPAGRPVRGRQRLRCTTCGTTFVPTTGTFMYRLCISEDAFLEAAMLHYGGYSSRRIAQAVGVSHSTVLRALNRAAEYADQVKLALIRERQVPQDVADRATELICWRAATKAVQRHSGTRRTTRRTRQRDGSLRDVAGAWADEDCDGILVAIYRLREHAHAAH